MDDLSRCQAIIPAVLERSPHRFRQRLAQLRRFAPTVHIDVADGLFVSGRTIGLRQLRGLPAGPRYELHCMVADPATWFDAAYRAGIQEVILHVEHPGLRRLILEARRKRFRVSLAVKPSTPLRRLPEALREVQRIVCLGVIPGKQGAPFVPSTLRRVRALSRRKRWSICVDGGVTLQRLPSLLRAGVRRFVVGSAITRQPIPAQAYRDFVAKLRERRR